MKSYKSVQVEIETYERLFRRKEHEKESMNSVIVRLLNKGVGGK